MNRISSILIVNSFSIELDTERKVLVDSGSHHSRESEVYMISGKIIFDSPVLLFEDGWETETFNAVFVIEYSDDGNTNLLSITIVEVSGKYGANFAVIDSSTEEFYDIGLFEKFSELI